MKKPIEQIKPNPHRNFDIYPIGEAQVALLMESIDEVGMFLGLPARKVGEFYEIACGHHRLEALKRVGITVVDLAVNNYTDEEMLKIMIRENSTQRGNENFGAVLDSVGAVLVQCVKDVYLMLNKRSPSNRNQNQVNLESGQGIGRATILSKEPSFSPRQVQYSLETFRNTDAYLKLLKKGGLPEEFWHLYEDVPTTSIEAVAMFPKPAHAAEWVKDVYGVKDLSIDLQEKLIESQNEMRLHIERAFDEIYKKTVRETTDLIEASRKAIKEITETSGKLLP